MPFSSRLLTFATVALLLGSNRASAQTLQAVFSVRVDTSPLNGVSGNLDLQFNQGGSGTYKPMWVEILDFQTDGIVDPLFRTSAGGVSGSLGGSPNLKLQNTSTFNDLFQGFTFGNSLRFKAQFTGGSGSPPQPYTSGSAFTLGLYDVSGFTPQLTTSPDGSILHIDLTADGDWVTQTFDDGTGIFRATVSPGNVPEPGTWAMLTGMGMTGVCLAFRGRRRNSRRV